MDARALWPASRSAADSFDWWGWLAGQLGADFPLKRPFLIGIRGVACSPVRASETHEVVAKPAYDDTFIFLTADAIAPPYVFAGATHPYQLNSTESPDINGDGRGDVGCIRAGRFELTVAITDPFPIFVLTMPGGSGNIPCFRDTDHDGRYSAAEISQQSIATAVLLHTGFDAPPASEHRSSIACQTANAADLRFLASHAMHYGKKIDYALINAEDAIALAADSPFQAAPGAPNS